jgi:hypothetical protein
MRTSRSIDAAATPRGRLATIPDNDSRATATVMVWFEQEHIAWLIRCRSVI